MSDSNRTALRYVRESTPGTTPTNPAFQTVTIRSSSLKYNPQSVTDDQIRSDEQVTDQTLVGYDTSGDIQARLTFGALDELYESAVFGTWNSRANAVPTAVSGTQFTVASGGTSFVANALVLATGFGVAANNGLKTVSASTSTTISASGLSVEASPPAATAKIRLVGMAFASGDVATNGTNKTFTVTAGDLTTLGLVAGMWVKIGGSATADQFATAGCNGWARIASATNKVITFDVVPTGWATDTGTGKTIKLWVGDYLRNGSTTTAYTFEREYNTDAGSTYYEYFKGVRVGKFGLKLSPRSNIETSFELMGTDASDVVATRGALLEGGSNTMGTITTKSPPTSALMNTSSNVAQIRINGATLSGASAVTDLSIDADRQLRMREGVGSMGAVDVRRGRQDVKASLTAYFESTNMINLLRKDTRSSMDLGLIDDNPDYGWKNGYYLDLPRIKASEGSINVEGTDTDVTVPMSFQGLMHETLGYTLQLMRFHYVE